MRLTLALATFAVLTPALADTLQLRGGRTVTGTYLGGTSRQIRMEVSGRVESFDVSDVSALRFETDAPAAQAAPAERPKPFRPSTTPPPAPPPAARASVEIPAGANVTVRMIDSVDSETAQLGQTFMASVDEPVVVNGETLIPRDSDVVVKLVEDKQAGRLSGRTELGLMLDSVTVNGRKIEITTEEVTQASSSRGSRTGKVVGGTAAVGAIIGAIAGGGRGAAIGAVSGAGAGAAVQVLTKGPKVRIPSETRLTFALAYPVRI